MSDRFVIEHFSPACYNFPFLCRLEWHNHVKDTVSGKFIHIVPLPKDSDLRLLNFMVECVLQDRGDVVQ